MGILDRLGDVFRSYLQDDEGGKSGPGARGNADPDYSAAWEELDEFLNDRKGSAAAGFAGSQTAGRTESKTGGHAAHKTAGATGIPPEELRGDFAELGVEFGASAETCKGAYKKLLKIHHPDRHAGHAGNMKKATEKSSRINTAYDRIEKWRNFLTAHD
jgi:DnaJ-domain-containing protein 1